MCCVRGVRIVNQAKEGRHAKIRRHIPDGEIEAGVDYPVARPPAFRVHNCRELDAGRRTRFDGSRMPDRERVTLDHLADRA